MKTVPKNLNIVAAAAAEGILRVELDAIEREVALRLPRKQALRELHQVLQDKLDAALLHVLTHQLGRVPEEEDLDDGVFQVHSSVDPEYPGDVYVYDGVPVLYAGPVELAASGDEMSAARNLVVLNDAPAMMGVCNADES